MPTLANIRQDPFERYADVFAAESLNTGSSAT